MKKTIALLLAFITVLLLISCNMDSTKNTDAAKNDGGTNENEKSPENSDEISEGEQPNDPNAKYIAVEDVVFTSDFFEGFAIVALREDLENFYVIDKSGKVAFTIKNDDFTNNAICQNAVSYSANMKPYKNGKMLFVDGFIYDTVGNVITPEQVGVTSFLNIKDGKYIVAEKISSTYDSMKTELGVLDMNLTWISALSEENNEHYDRRYDENIEFWESILGENQNSSDDFNFETITNHVEHTKFVNGKSGVLMYNRQSGECFVSVIDNQGNFLFAPTKIDSSGSLLNPCIYFDGNIVVASVRSNGSASTPLKVSCFDLTGANIGSFDSVSAGLCKSNSDSVTFSYNDGVVLFRIRKGTYSEYYRQSEVRYYTCDFKELFQN